MKNNPYRLGLDHPSHDEYTQFYLEQMDKGNRRAHNIKDYWHVRHLNLNKSEEETEKMVLDAYGCSLDESHGFYLPGHIFVTDNEDLFLNMYSILHLDFIYDFKSKLFFLDLFAHHETIRMELFELTGKKAKSDAAEEYISEGMGMFKSSQSPIVWIGEDVACPRFFLPHKHRLERI